METYSGGKLILLSSGTLKHIIVPLKGRWETITLDYLARAQLINSDRKKEHHNQLAATHSQTAPFLHSGAAVLTNAGGLTLWSVRTVDCYSRFDGADAEPMRNYFNGHQQKTGREKKRKKANYFPLHSP